MRIVVKVGTSTLTYPSGQMNIRRVEKMVKILSDLKNAGHEIILVSSGAIAMGCGKLHLTSRPKDTPTKQAAAAVGQCELMYVYDRSFGEYNHTVAQILLSAADVENNERCRNFENTLNRLLAMGALPVINENDTVSTEEFSLSDNDNLAAIISCCICADLLILMSDIDGLYTADPHRCENSELIPYVAEITPELEAMAGGAGSERGTGGMASKLRAARLVTDAGCDMIIMNGEKPELLYDAVENTPVGTRFAGKRG